MTEARTPLESIAFAAWVNCPPDAMPSEYRQHTCEATMTAWRRVVAALFKPEAIAASPEVAKLIAEAVAAERERCAEAVFAYMISKDPDVLDARISAAIADFEDEKHAMAGLVSAAIRSGE